MDARRFSGLRAGPSCWARGLLEAWLTAATGLGVVAGYGWWYGMWNRIADLQHGEKRLTDGCLLLQATTSPRSVTVTLSTRSSRTSARHPWARNRRQLRAPPPCALWQQVVRLQDGHWAVGWGWFVRRVDSSRASQIRYSPTMTSIVYTAAYLLRPRYRAW